MRPPALVPVARLSALAVSLFLALPTVAQIHGVPASVTSPGFGGRAVNGPRASVTSLGPQGFSRPHPPLLTAGNPPRHGDGHHHRRQDNEFVGPVWYAVPVPYAVETPAAEDQPDDADNDSDDQGGPTVFDRRGSGERSYVPPMKDAPPAHAERPVERTEEVPPAEPDPPLPPTLLVFKDGRTLEVSNYAIIGPTLFDLTPGHRRKVAIIELDLDATRKQNDERGVVFQLPQSTPGS